MKSRIDVAPLIARVCEVRRYGERELAMWLGVSVMALRAWKRRPAPRYVALALVAMLQELDRGSGFRPTTPAPRDG